jgi:ElaB/YqjD/DUF883 family membrane-anchored ribosome-binding protein
MQTASDTNTGTGVSSNSTDRRHDSAAPATQSGRHYGEHGHAATANTGPSMAGATEAARDMANRAGEQAGSALAKAVETAEDLANRVGEQTRPAIAKITETAHDLASRAREQTAPATQAVYDQGARAGQYVTRNIHQYPATALLIAAAVGYGLAYLLHGGGRSLRWGRREDHNHHDKGAR